MNRRVLLTATILILIGLALDALRGDRKSHDQGPVTPPLLSFLYRSSPAEADRPKAWLAGRSEKVAPLVIPASPTN